MQIKSGSSRDMYILNLARNFANFLENNSAQGVTPVHWELRNIYHHHHLHPESKIRNSSEANSGFIHAYGRYGNAVKTSKPYLP